MASQQAEVGPSAGIARGEEQSASGAQLALLPAEAASPAVAPVVPENMSTYVKRLKEIVCTSSKKSFRAVEQLEGDGLYIGKRPIIGAQGQGQLLNEAGSVFYHTCLYLKAGDKVTGLDFGPAGMADVTANVMEAAPCGPVVHPNAVPDVGQPLLSVDLPVEALDSQIVQKAIAFVEGRQYHAINNNCIHNTDFLCRVLTGGRLRNGPLVYDAVAGKVPEHDHPMLLMFFLMTRLSWFHICDGSPLTAAFMEAEGALLPGPKPSTDPGNMNVLSTGQQARPAGTGNGSSAPQIDLAALLQAAQAAQNKQPSRS